MMSGAIGMVLAVVAIDRVRAISVIPDTPRSDDATGVLPVAVRHG